MLLLGAVFAATLAHAGPAKTETETARFTIHDHRDPVEVDEVTRVFMDGAQIGAFRLGPEREADEMTVSVTGSGRHHYALCGRVTVRRDDGTATTREVNGSGELSDVDGRDYDAVAASDFTVFYLRDITPGRVPTAVSAEPQRGCMPNVAGL